MGRGDPTVPVLEQWTILSAAAGATSRIGIGTFVTNVMNRHPAVLARMAARSRRRAAAGSRSGSGSAAPRRSIAAYGIDFPEVDERVAAARGGGRRSIRALWTGGPVTRPGRSTRSTAPTRIPRRTRRRGSSSAASSPRGRPPGRPDRRRLGGGDRPTSSELCRRTARRSRPRARRSRDAWIALGFGGGKTGAGRPRATASGWTRRARPGRAIGRWASTRSWSPRAPPTTSTRSCGRRSIAGSRRRRARLRASCSDHRYASTSMTPGFDDDPARARPAPPPRPAGRSSRRIRASAAGARACPRTPGCASSATRSSCRSRRRRRCTASPRSGSSSSSSSWRWRAGPSSPGRDRSAAPSSASPRRPAASRSRSTW